MVAAHPVDIEGLERANREAARLLGELAGLAKPGARTIDLERHARRRLAQLGAEPVFHTEAGFPTAINTSLNDAVLHGVPSETALQSGDVLSIDAGLRLDGYCGDAALTQVIGRALPRLRRLVAVAKRMMESGVAAAVAGNRIGDISAAMQAYAERRGFGVLRDFAGHGVGRRMHEWPSVPFVGEAGTGPALVEGLVITIEPAIVEGLPDWWLDADGWTVRTSDGGWAAQFEHTVMVTRDGPQILSVA
jgi:methionyl aminopeptidase